MNFQQLSQKLTLNLHRHSHPTRRYRRVGSVPQLHAFAEQPEERILLSALPLQPNNIGTKLHHPGLSSDEVLEAVNLAGAAYANEASDLAKYYGLSQFDFGLEGWSVVTDELLSYGLDSDRLKNDFYYQSPSYPTLGLVNAIFPGTAEAIVLRNATDVALAFRGTSSVTDAFDWSPVGQASHYLAFSDLFDALDNYVTATGASRMVVAGHSLGAAMTEIYMSLHPDSAALEYEAVAVASPLASFTSDPRVLNIGHESDIVYSVIGARTTNAVSETNAVFDEFLLGDVLDVGNQHSIAVSYRHTTETLLQSQFYRETDRDTRVIFALTNDTDELAEVAEDFFRDNPSLVLGRNKPITREDGVTLSENDFLVGGANSDRLEGFAGDDVLRGDVVLLVSGGDDILSGGPGKDMFLGTPGELDGDEITDLEVGDRIGVLGETIAQEDVTLTSDAVVISSEGGFFDFFGREVNIKLSNPLPPGASLRVLDETLEGGGSIIEVVGMLDLVFVIDTTGSMSDDIAAVQEAASELVSSILVDGSDNRVGIVLFRDHGDDYVTATQLPFSNSRDATLAAIANITVSGGGDIPEAVFSGLVHAIDGQSGLGHWRGDGVPKKIILMGDAPPKDPEPVTGYTAAFIKERAGAGGIEVGDAGVPASLSDLRVGGEISLISTAVAGDERLPVDIVTILIEDSSSALAAFELIASENRGTTFQADDSTEVVNAILAAIDSITVPDVTRGTVQGRKWHDKNLNGNHDDGEAWLDGWTIELLNETGDVIDTTITAAIDLDGNGIIDAATEGGVYRFTGLVNGTYEVREATRDGWTQAFPASPVSRTVASLDAALEFRTTANNFQDWAGLSERWLYSNNGWHYVTPAGGLFKWTSGRGATLQSQFVAKLNPDYYNDLNLLASPAAPQAHQVTITTGSQVTGVDFGNYGASTIQGQKWEDSDADGAQDSSERFMNGWEIQLIDSATGNVVASTTTQNMDLNLDGLIDPQTEVGVYYFAGVVPGKYEVREVLKAGWIQSTPTQNLLSMAHDLDTSREFQTKNGSFLSWGNLNEKWLQGNDGWYYITPDGALYKWNLSPRTALTGTKAAQLSPWFYSQTSRLTDAVDPSDALIDASNEVHITGANIGNYRANGASGLKVSGKFDPTFVPGNATVTISKGDVRIVGDKWDNQVGLFVDWNHNLIAVGLQGTTINGQSGAVTLLTNSATVTGSVIVELNGGDDLIALQGFKTGKNVSINGEIGEDSVFALDLQVGGNFDVLSSWGAGTVVLSNTSISKNLTIFGSEAQDDVVLDRVVVSNRTNVQLGAAADRLIARGSVFHDDASINLGLGNDAVIALGANDFKRLLRVNGGAGSDAASASSVPAGRKVFLGIESNQVPNLSGVLDQVLSELATLGLDGLLLN